METIEKRLKYYELLMTYDDTSKVINYELPDQYSFEFYQEGDIDDWIDIHIKSGEFANYEKGREIFNAFFNEFLDELPQRCLFIVNDKNEKIGTATISPLKEKEYGYDAAVDWVAIKREYQGKHLSKPLISRFVQLAHELGHEKLILHTQTHTWLAAKIYLDFGFMPYRIDDDYEGWRILKTITDHPKLKDIKEIPEKEIYSKTAQMIYEKISKIHRGNFNYEIWYKNDLNTIYVYDYEYYYEYKYYLNDDVKIELIKKKKAQ